jgi:hypothetical protein
VNDKTEKEDDWIEDEQREIIERLGITPDEEGKVALGEVLEKLGEEEGMAIFPLCELEIKEGSEQSEVEPKKLEASETDIVEHSQEPRIVELNLEVQHGENEVPQVVEQAEPNVLARLESQDLSSLEAELLQPEIEIEPKIEEVEPEEPY